MKHPFIKLLLPLCLGFSWNAWGVQATPLACSDILLNLKSAFGYHLSHHSMTPDLIDRMHQSFIHRLDPDGIIFLQSDTRDFLELGKKGKYRKKNLSIFEKVRDRFAAAIADVQSCLADLEREKQGILSQIMGFVPEPSAAPSTARERREKLRKHLMLQTRSLMAASYGPSEAFDIALRVLRNQINETSLVRTKPTTNLVLKAWMSALDPNSRFADDEDLQMGSDVKPGGLGIDIFESRNGVRITRVRMGSPGQRGGLQAGDEITEAGGRLLLGLGSEEVAGLLQGEVHEPIELSLTRKGQAKKITLNRESTRLLSAEVPSPHGNLGIIAPTRFYRGLADEMAEVVQRWKQEGSISGIVLDLRGNRGGETPEVESMLSVFLGGLKGHKILGADFLARRQKAFWEGALVVLVDGHSASASETAAGSLQDYGRAIVVSGDPKTYGKGTQQRRVQAEMKTGFFSWREFGELWVTAGITIRPSGKSPQAVGIEPDIIIPKAGKSHGGSPDQPGAVPPFETDSFIPPNHVPRISPQTVAELKTRLASVFQTDQRWQHPENWTWQVEYERHLEAATVILDELIALQNQPPH